ncbi:MAG: pitrilysin family protein, partial [Verrucomicrobia bacterium]|nr:pitrilysin family protein [Verrucomicrobiota bacterium]
IAGVPVVLRPNDEAPGVAVGLFYPAGSRWETESEHGAAHFVEHLLFKGTKKHTCKELSREVEGRGGDLNAFTGEETLCLHGRVPAGHGSRLISLLAEMALESTFPKEEVERERGVITEEIRMMDDQPAVVAGEALNALLWPNQALGRPIAGTIESIGKIPRKGLLDYWQRRVRGIRPVLVVAGGISTREAVETARRSLIRSGREKSLEPVRAKRVQSKTLRVTAVTKPVAQVNVMIGVYAFGRNDPRRHALRMLSVILGEAMSSRLFQRLREERGLVYSVSSGVHLQRDDGAFYISAGLEPGNLAKALGLIAEELQSLATKGPGAAELKRAKDYATGQFALGLEGTSQQMFWLGDAMLTRGRVVEPKEAIGNLTAVGAKMVQEVARVIFQPGRVGVAAAGPNLNVKQLGLAAHQLSKS